MSQRHLALTFSYEIADKRRELSRQWNGFLVERQIPCAVRPVVQNSWKRCMESGVDPTRRQTTVLLSDEDVQKLIANFRLYQLALPILERLAKQTEGTGHLLTLCNHDGFILYLRGEQSILRRAEKMNFVVGSQWSEETIGTNAIGTCLETGQPVQIFASEHFCEGVHDWTCSSAPIFDPITQNILGVVDLTGPWDYAQPHSLGMVVAASQLIQQRLNEEATRHRYRLIERFWEARERYPEDGVVVLDLSFQVVQANSPARHWLTNNEGYLPQLLYQFLTDHRSNADAQKCKPLQIQTPDAIVIEEVFHGDARIGFLCIIRNKPAANRSKSLKRSNASWKDLVGHSPAIVHAMTKCEMVADTDVPVLLLGESGTGKERFARAIHASSRRRNKPFIAINCGAIPKELIAAELFGYEPGTFTGGLKQGKKGKFEEADGGTLFLDEIGEMPLEFQVHLLRVLQEKEILRLGGHRPTKVDVRIIAATHRDLDKMVQEKRFRADLFYRLHVVSIAIPPLRDRRDDIPLLLDHFVRRFADKYNRPIPKIDPDLKAFLVHRYDWPGNVRELENAVEHAMLFCTGDKIDSAHFPPAIGNAYLSDTQQQTCTLLTVDSKNELTCTSDDSPSGERERLMQILSETNGNLSEAARRLGIARTTLYRRLKKLGIKKRAIIRAGNP
ncbi:sigma-54-dependent Fis family transcriptional regulator [Polycladomyces subterraneus]|uniref:Sigma-54-dependent Fis family transcriptional regulator n=1 Tax=Polycladomyces subterraneus TaxID=1016997 RepID=A0ABT8IQD2_9BACL|nr:sigma-54-dependent Fis family transcriptional regulator [Polycladomyces subterraneus]MDN4594617.1 sigma-54-dependent Fis family transcriptional regulator [Polycladomyces subterraneus]